MTEILFCSSNAHKLREVREILGPEFLVHDISVLGPYEPPEETGSTFAENASLKAVAASQRWPGWALADDSGLEVDALNGAPGVLSARYAGPGAGDRGNLDLLLQNLRHVAEKDRTARFRCTLALAREGRVLHVCHGTVEGVISLEPHGCGGFGYDPAFIPEGHHQTFGELPAEIKNSISHRRRALEKMRVILQNELNPRP